MSRKKLVEIFLNCMRGYWNIWEGRQFEILLKLHCMNQYPRLFIAYKLFDLETSMIMFTPKKKPGSNYLIPWWEQDRTCNIKVFNYRKNSMDESVLCYIRKKHSNTSLLYSFGDFDMILDLYMQRKGLIMRY